MKKAQVFTIFYFILFQTIIAQDWTQIGAKSIDEIDESLLGLKQSQIGMIWNVKFEPQYDLQLNQTRLFASGVNSGLYLNENGQGNSWVLLNTDLLPQTNVSAIGDFVINPTDRDEIFIGTGVYKLTFSKNGDPIYIGGQGFFKGKLINGGISWSKTDQSFIDGLTTKTTSQFWNEPGSKKFVTKILQLSNSNYVTLIADDHGSFMSSYIYKSTDGGSTWVKKFEMPDQYATDIDVDPFNSDHIIVTGNYHFTQSVGIITPHFIETSDKGTTWNTLSINFSDIMTTTTFYKLSFSKSYQNIIYVAKFSNNNINVYKIDIVLPSISLYTQELMAHNIGKGGAFEMQNDDRFLIGSLTTVAYHLDPNNIQLAEQCNVDVEIHADIRDFAYYPDNSGSFVMATDGGINKFEYSVPIVPTDPYYHSSVISNGLEIDRILRLSSYQKNKEIYGYSHWDNAPLFRHGDWLKINNVSTFYSPAGGESNCFGIGKNQAVFCGLNGDGVFRYNFDFSKSSLSTMDNYVAQLGANSLYFNSPNGILSYRQLVVDFVSMNDIKGIMLLVGGVYNLSNPNQGFDATGIFSLPYFDSNNPYSSNIIQQILPPPSAFFPLSLGKAYVQPRMSMNNGDFIYTAVNYGVDANGAGGITIFKSTNCGVNWQQINSNSPFGGQIKDIAVDPLDPNQICLVSENGLILWNTTNGNNTINIINSHAPSPINVITYVNSNTILAGTDAGLYIFYLNFNGAPLWVDYNSLLTTGSKPLPKVRIADVEYLFDYNLVRVATMGIGAFENVMPPDICDKLSGVLEVNGEFDIHVSQTSHKDILIKEHSILRIKANCVLKMAKNTKITIEKSGKLIIESGGKITNLCDNTTWDGIIAYGNSSLSQSDYLQTKVTLVGATIKNAKSAIHLERGAVLNANSSNFENCHHSISFSNPTHTASLSVINECTFTCNHPIFGYPFESQSDFINLYNIYGVIISGNHFENSIPEGVTTYDYRGKGIYSIDASYKLIPSSSLINISDPNCPVPAGTPNTFVQLSIGIEMANGTLTSNKLDAIQNVFENCGEAIKIKSSIGSRLFMNEIIMSNIYSGKLNHTAYTGISFDNSTDFIAEHNTINMNFTSINRYYDYVGIIVNNSDMAPLPNLAKSSFIYHNSISITANLNGFTYTSKGLLTSNDNTNLQLLCNSYSNLSKGMVLTGKLNNQCMINNIPNAAENSFIGIPNPNDMIDGVGLSTPITYYYNNIPYPGGLNISVAPIFSDKCNNSFYGTLSSYYCTDGNGNIDPGDPIVIGDNGDNLGLKKVDVTPAANTNILITLQNFSDKPLDVTISNTQGVNLITKHFNNLTNINAIDIQGLPEGLYNLKVTNSIGEFATCQFIVLRQ